MTSEAAVSSGSAGETSVSLLLETGERFDGVSIVNSEASLKDFLDAALKALENESRLQLPDTEELIDTRDFKVYDENRTMELDLCVSLKEQPYFICCRNSGDDPCLILSSTLFRNARQLERENRADSALRRQNSGTLQSGQPEIPERDSSLNGYITKKDEVLYLAGRKPYFTPSSLSRGNYLTASTSNNSLASDINSEGAEFPGGLNVGDAMDKIFSGSSMSLAMSDDSTSILSSDVVSAVTPEVVRRTLQLRHPSALGLSTNSLQPGHAPRPESPNPPSYSGGMRSRSHGHKPLRNNRSTPPPLLEERAGGLDLISEEGGVPTHISRRISQGSQGSLQVVLEPPTSPDSPTPPLLTPNVSVKKRRIAQSRKWRKDHDQDGARTGVGGTADGEERITASPLSIRRNHRTIYAKSRVVSSILPLKVFGNIKTFTVEFDIPYAEICVQMEVRGDFTVGQIKDNLWSSLKEQGVLDDEFGSWWDPENFTFTYEMKKEKYELYDEQQIFQMSQVIQWWRAEKMELGMLVVEEKRAESKEEKTLNMEISAMIGIGLYQLQFANSDELDITRRKMVAVRRNAVTSRDPIEYCMEPDHTFETLSPHILKYLFDRKFLIRVFYNLGDGNSQPQSSYQTIQAELSCPADELMDLVFPQTSAKRERYGVPEDCDPKDCVLKVAGQNSFLYGASELRQFSYVVNSLSKNLDIELTLVNKLTLDIDKLWDVEDWSLIDAATGETGCHSDLSALSKEHTQVFTMSMWDIPRKFRVRVVGLDNVRYSECEVLYVVAGLYHGGVLLDEIKFISEVPSTPYPRWNQWLVFDIPTKCLPKAARLSLQVVGGNRHKNEKKKSLRGRKQLEDKRGDGGQQLDNALHWINMQILDHRSMLRQGLIRLNMWPVLLETQKGPISAQTSPMGSTAVNPDGNNSAVLYIELDTYAHPIACPTHGWGHDIPSSMETIPNNFKKELEVIIKGDPLVVLTSPQREILWKFREYCSTIPEALPKLLHCVQWGSLEQVTEMHKLIKIWRPITLEVALELLDYHFADEKVRTLAVRRLEKLSNGELQSFLLQMVQVLKFEPYHDSALARFLLKRSLKSKKIGHYFYWYLRSEMDTPEFNQRFGILLESYLRGCGESMFREIQKQHKAVCDIMQVASSIKKQPDKNKADLARDYLSKYEFPLSFSPPYDPMVVMGNLNIQKCRVMDSKKTPIWLEFENMDPTDISKRPVKVIAKHGDDLRQDMLTLQMLSLMDRMWQAKGLDLHIISYGCIATGNMRGMIQVVQDAETVAKIQLNHGGSFSALKDEPLYDWLKKKNPVPARFDAAVKKFMLSCAGYCVATYILGIGDRHNDNIMVTTSGNLFHIDFGHFLGYKKYFMGMNRERAPFVLTPDFEYVMGKRNSETFKKFEETAVRAYMIIRNNANMIINLFSMMKCTGIPELQSVEDLEYLRSVFVLGRSDCEAKEHFKAEIQKCLKLQWSTQLNWFTHNIVHR